MSNVKYSRKIYVTSVNIGVIYLIFLLKIMPRTFFLVWKPALMLYCRFPYDQLKPNFTPCFPIFCSVAIAQWSHFACYTNTISLIKANAYLCPLVIITTISSIAIIIYLLIEWDTVYPVRTSPDYGQLSISLLNKFKSWMSLFSFNLKLYRLLLLNLNVLLVNTLPNPFSTHDALTFDVELGIFFVISLCILSCFLSSSKTLGADRMWTKWYSCNCLLQ